MKELLQKKGFICDMDGVIYHGNHLLPGVTEIESGLDTALVLSGVTSREESLNFPSRLYNLLAELIPVWYRFRAISVYKSGG